jgi:acyl carrier protein
MNELDDFRKVVSNISKVPIEKIQEHSSFRDELGMDSLSMVNLIIEISERYGLELGRIQRIEDIATVGNMYQTFFREVTS